MQIDLGLAIAIFLPIITGVIGYFSARIKLNKDISNNKEKISVIDQRVKAIEGTIADILPKVNELVIEKAKKGVKSK